MGPSFCLALLCLRKKIGGPLLCCSLVLLFPFLLLSLLLPFSLLCFVIPWFNVPFYTVPLLCYTLALLLLASLHHCFATPLFHCALASLHPMAKMQIGADINEIKHQWNKTFGWKYWHGWNYLHEQIYGNSMMQWNWPHKCNWND